jgi:putative aminopeptidase FrvX
VVSVNVAVTNIHSETELVALSDVESLLRLGEAMIATLHTLPGAGAHG